MIATPTITQQPQYQISDDDRARQQRIADNWIAYDGELEEPLEHLPDGTNPNVMSNAVDPPVDTLADFLFGEDVTISVEEGAPQEAQQLLDEVWGRKEKKIPLLQDLGMNGSVAGRAFLRIVPDESTSPDEPKSFRLVVPDPATVFVQQSPQDCETVLLYCIEYSVQETINGKLERVFYREEIQRIGPDGKPAQKQTKKDTWSIQHWTRIGERGQWQTAGEAIPWPWPFAPLFSCKNLPRPNLFWGKPDVTQWLINMNKSLNLAQSNVSIIQTIYGQPILYGNGIGDSVMDIKPGRVQGLPTPDSKISAVAITSDQPSALTFISKLQEQLDIGFSVPAAAQGRLIDMPRTGMSGVALELEFMPILKKNRKKQNLYGGLLIEVSLALLVLAGYSPDIKISLAWGNPLPHDDLADAQSAVTKEGLGISKTTLMRELGYDPEEEFELSQSEDQQKILAYSRGQGFLPANQPLPPEQQQPGESPTSPFIGGGH